MGKGAAIGIACGVGAGVGVALQDWAVGLGVGAAIFVLFTLTGRRKR